MYTVTFKANGGTFADGKDTRTETVESGRTATKPDDPINGDMELVGWYTSADGGKTLTDTAYSFGIPVESNITLYAAWKVAEYTVTFNANGGTFSDGNGTKTETVESGRTATKPDDPTLEGSWFSGWYGDSGLTKEFDFTTPITADTSLYAKWSYKLHTEPSILTNYTSPNHTDSSWKYVEFGDWPQTIKAADVTVDETKSKAMGMFTCYLGSDGNYYVKAEEKAYKAGYRYSDGTTVGQGGSTTKWFKVEPIVWRVLTEDYKAPGGKSTNNALLLAEKILTCGIPYYDVYNVDRTVGDTTIYPNNYEHSGVRAYLNGLEYQYKKFDNTAQTTEKKYLDVGFLQTAFTQSARNLIADTTVDNSAASTNPASNPTRWDGGINQHASDTPTTDKIFLLSEAEATTSEYGFDEYRAYGNTRIRVITDYAKATGANYGDWWLRSPVYYNGLSAHVIGGNGYADGSYLVSDSIVGVVPALSISLK